MRNGYMLLEDTRPKRLTVSVSSKIKKSIADIYKYNQDNPTALSQWVRYIESLRRYISNPAIAFDYANRYVHYPNGAIHLVEMNYDVSFITKSNDANEFSYVYIFGMDFKLKDFGLKNPTIMNESCKKKKAVIVTEFQLRSIISECVSRLYEIQRKKRVEKYTAIDGDWWDGVPHGLESKCCYIQDVRMYDSIEETIGLFRRCDNLKYFYAKIVPDKGKETKWQPMKLSEVPIVIRNDFSTINPSGHEPYLPF